jgi:GntR family transcriptional regulator
MDAEIKKDKAMYQIIEADIKNRIASNELQIGDMIESENVLKEKYGVSRMTVRQALSNLVNEGYLYRHKGKGTFVNDLKLSKKIYGFIGFSEEMKLSNKSVDNEIIEFALIEASDKVADKLLINKGEKVYKVVRLRYGDHIPVLLEELYVPHRLFKDLRKEVFETSFYDHVENEMGYKMSYCTQKIEAINCNEEKAKLLHIDPGAALLYISLISYLDNGRPFEYVKSYYRGDQYHFLNRSFR